MNDAFIFERPAWELLLDTIPAGGTVPALRFLSVLLDEDDMAFEEAYEALLAKRLVLDISRLPEDFGSGEMAQQLRREHQLVDQDDLIGSLEELDPLRLYLEELAQTPAQGDVDVLIGLLKQQDASAPEKLAALYLHRAVEIAKEYTGRGVLLLDLMQEASLGLWQGILQYEDGDFDEQIQWWIRHSVCRLILLQARQSGTVQTLQQSMEAFGKADRRLLAELGRNASLEEIAVELGITPEQAERISDMVQNAKTLEQVKQPASHEEDEDKAVEDTAYFQSRQRIAELLSSLTEEQARVLSLRFGLDGAAPATPQAVAAKLGLSVDAVMAMEAQALTQLRNEQTGE